MNKKLNFSWTPAIFSFIDWRQLSANWQSTGTVEHLYSFKRYYAFEISIWFTISCFNSIWSIIWTTKKYRLANCSMWCIKSKYWLTFMMQRFFVTPDMKSTTTISYPLFWLRIDKKRKYLRMMCLNFWTMES